MTPNIVLSFDGVTSADTSCGSILALDNGTVAFVPILPLAFGPTGSVAMAMLDASLAPRGLTWGTVQNGGTARQGYVSRLEKPNEERLGATVKTPSGSVRLARSNEQVAALAEVAAAFEAGDLSTLLTPQAWALETSERARVEKKAAKVAADAKAFAHANWPKAAFGLTVTEMPHGLVVQFNYDAAVVKVVKASKGVWSATRKSWTLSREHEAAFGKRLMRIARELGKLSEDTGISLADQALQQESELLEEERAAPLTGKVGMLTIGLRHYPYAPPGLQHTYTVRFPYHAAMIGLVRGVPGARFNRDAAYWEVPLVARKSLAHKMQYLRPHALEYEARALAPDQQSPELATQRAQPAAATREAEGKPRGVHDSARGAAQIPTETWNIRRFAERDGGGLPTGIYCDGEQWNVVVERSRGRYVEDASSVGGDMGREYEFRLTVRAATRQEADQALAKRAQAAAKFQEAKARCAAFELLHKAFRIADCPDGADVPQSTPSTSSGYLMDVNGMTTSMGDGLTKFVIDRTLGKLWRVQENGHDGDDWSRNNYRGSIASCLSLDGADKVVAFLEAARAPLTSPAPALMADDVDAWAIPAQRQGLCEQAPVQADASKAARVGPARHYG
jgi:hypothetical protein